MEIVLVKSCGLFYNGEFLCDDNVLKAEKKNDRLLNERNIEVLNMNNLRYIIDDIKSMKVKYSIIFVQLLVGLGIFLYLFQTSCAYLKTEQEIQKKTAQENIYMFQDSTIFFKH